MNGDETLKEFVEKYFKLLEERFDKLDKFMEITGKQHNTLNGERLLDNQDLCQMLHVSKRTLQRYRTEEGLEYIRFHQKTYYREKDVEKFVREKFKSGKMQQTE